MAEKYILRPDELEYLAENLSACTLCEWQCEVNRLYGERGVCGITIPEVSSSQLHPAPPASFDAFMTGCSFRCLSCQNWPVANYPDNKYYDVIEGYYPPDEWIELALAALQSGPAKQMSADRLFFTGGEPTCSLPWIEAVIKAARLIAPGTKVNYDTNGFMTKKSLASVLSFSDSITFDIKAFDPNLFKAITGAEVAPVLRNAEHIAHHAPDKLWEFRVLVIPHLHEPDVIDLCEFIADLGAGLPVNFLAFRPNFVMDEHPWAARKLMEHCMDAAKKAGLENVSWSGRTNDGLHHKKSDEVIKNVVREHADSSKLPGNAALAMGYAQINGCTQINERNCGSCKSMDSCTVKRYTTEYFH